jgi:hypothetical protein
MKSGSAKQSAEDNPNRATTSKKVFLNAKGLILTRTIVDMVITSNGHAKPKGQPNPDGGNFDPSDRMENGHRVASEKECLLDYEEAEERTPGRIRFAVASGLEKNSGAQK